MAQPVPLHRKGLFLITVLCLGCVISGLSFKKLPWQRMMKNPSPVQKVSTLKLTDTKWVWKETRHADGTLTQPRQSDRFVLSFDGKRFTSSTDCNGMSGSYSAKDGVMFFGDIASTLMFCENSQENVYAEALRQTSSYTIEGKTLQLMLKDSAEMTFEAQTR